LSTTELLQADEHTKIYWLEASAYAGNKEAMSRMGVLYYKGHYYPKDLNKAKIWLKRAADQNDAKALYNLGFIYYNGSGIEQVDIKKAVNCFKKAAELDFPPAFYTLSVLYEAGIGVEKNRTVSRQLMEKASALGYSKSG
jgi:TPR repeat protein